MKLEPTDIIKESEFDAKDELVGVDVIRVSRLRSILQDILKRIADKNREVQDRENESGKYQSGFAYGSANAAGFIEEGFGVLFKFEDKP